jgi:hypothetical protein
VSIVDTTTVSFSFVNTLSSALLIDSKITSKAAPKKVDPDDIFGDYDDDDLDDETRLAEQKRRREEEEQKRREEEQKKKLEGCLLLSIMCLQFQKKHCQIPCPISSISFEFILLAFFV